MDEERVNKFASYVERTAWLQILFGILTQVSAEVAFPSYNVVLGFWGVYAAINRHGRATFGYISFEFLSILLDVVFCAVNGSADNSSGFKFALAMFIFCLFSKLLSLYFASYYFAAMGGALSMELDMGQSVYESFVRGGNESRYRPPDRGRGPAASNNHHSDEMAGSGYSDEAPML